MADKLRRVRAWEIWANPILLRYMRSRLRWRGLAPAALATLIFTTFFFCMFYIVVSKEQQRREVLLKIRPLAEAEVKAMRPDLEEGRNSFRTEVSKVRERLEAQLPPPSDVELREHRRQAARTAMFPLLIAQAVILILVGTGAVASGITQEGIEGMVEYHRLTPMTPTAKIIGYLFGLPIREYVLALLTLPFLAFATFMGQIPLQPLGLFYTVFLSSVMLYHLTGLVAGSVVKRRWMAGRTAQIIVVVLYLLLPRLSAFGLVFFPYLTVYPALDEHLPQLVKMSDMGKVIFKGPGAADGQSMVPWFRWEFTPTQFSLLIQLSLCVIFAVMLHRRWRDAQSHLLGKPFAVLAFAGVMALLLGNVLPLIEGNGFSWMEQHMRGRSVEERATTTRMEVHVKVAIFGFALMCFTLMSIYLITPERMEMIRGLRRAKKLGQKRVSPRADEGSSLWAAWLMIGMAAVTWCVYTQANLRQAHLPMGWLWAGQLSAALILPCVCFHAALETYGKRMMLIGCLLLWIVPILGAIILTAIRDRFGPPEAFLSSLSGFASPFLATGTVVGFPDPSGMGNEKLTLRVKESAKAIRHALPFALLLYAALIPVLLRQWSRYRAKLVAEVGLGKAHETPAHEAPAPQAA